MFTMILEDGSTILTKIIFLATYVDQIAEIYPHEICNLVWSGGREYNYTCFPHQDFSVALKMAIKSGSVGHSLNE